MLLIQSIIVYSLFAYLLYRNAKLAINDYPLEGQYKNMYSLPKHYWTCIFIFCLISGVRWNVGVDYPSYYWSYMHMMDGTYMARERGIEQGYLFLSQTFAKFGVHPILYFAFLAFLEVYFIILALRVHRNILPFAFLFIVLGGTYTSLMSGLRQEIVACAFLFFSRYILNKKLLHYLIWIAVCYSMHHSVLILIPFYLLAYDRTIWNKTYLNVTIFLTCLYLGNNLAWTSNISNFAKLFEITGYNTYFDELTDSSNYVSFSVGPRLIVGVIVHLFNIFLYKTICKWKNNDTWNLWFKLYFIGICGYYLFMNTSHVFLRPFEYFSIFSCCIVGFTMLYLKIVKSNLFILYAVVALSYTMLSCFIENRLPVEEGHNIIYQFFFVQK